MPELPEVETVKRGLAPVLEHNTIVSAEVRRDGLRFAFPPRFAERLKGRRMGVLSRRAKYIIIPLDGAENLLVHLGMTGRFTVLPGAGAPANLGAFYKVSAGSDNADGPHDHVVLTLKDATRVVYTDPRRFGLMDLVDDDQMDSHRLLRAIGVEPLGNRFDAAFLAKAFKTRSTPLKAALLDQRIIAGLGNIYVCEALYRARLAPARKSSTIARPSKRDQRIERLVAAVRAVLNEAIAAGGSTLRDFAGTDGSEGGFQQRFDVYGREGGPCRTPGCTSHIKRLVQSGRSTFYCPRCQR